MTWMAVDVFDGVAAKRAPGRKWLDLRVASWAAAGWIQPAGGLLVFPSQTAAGGKGKVTL